MKHENALVKKVVLIIVHYIFPKSTNRVILCRIIAMEHRFGVINQPRSFCVLHQSKVHLFLPSQ